MSRLSPDAYVAHVRTESDRFRAVLSGCDPDARVPACPDWTAADLLHHLTGVQTFWSVAIEHRPAEPAEDDRSRAPSYRLMLADAEAATDRLVGALASAVPTEEAWTWSADHTVGFVQRRQALEALVHRVDAEQAAGVASPLDPLLAADGVDEVLDVMFGGHPPWGVFTPGSALVRVEAGDVDQAVWVRLGRFVGTDPESGREYDVEDVGVVADPGTDPDVVVAGSAEDLLLWLWRRRSAAGVRISGDGAVHDRFRAIVDQPIE